MIDERVRYTISYAAEHSACYRKWFKKNNINAEEIRTHMDLPSLPIIFGKIIRVNQPPAVPILGILSTDNQTHGTSVILGRQGGALACFFPTQNLRWCNDKCARIRAYLRKPGNISPFLIGGNCVAQYRKYQ
jgi:hypothetical protein